MQQQPMKNQIIDIAAGKQPPECLDPDYYKTGEEQDMTPYYNRWTEIEDDLLMSAYSGLLGPLSNVSKEILIDLLCDPEILNRVEGTNTRIFNCLYLPGKICCVEYEHSDRRPTYQVCAGWIKTHQMETLSDEVVLCLDLHEWQPGIDYQLLTDKELCDICILMHKENSGKPKDDYDNEFLLGLIVETPKREKVEHKYLSDRCIDIIYYKDGTAREELNRIYIERMEPIFKTNVPI
jgi:hypothetical protein